MSFFLFESASDFVIVLRSQDDKSDLEERLLLLGTGR